MRRFFVRRDAKVIVKDWLERMLGDQYNDHGKLVIDPNCSSLLAGFYECQGNISINSLDNASVVFTDIIFHHDIRNALYLFSKLNAIEISEIYITNTSNKKFPQNMIDLFKLFFKGKKRCGLRVKAGDVMKIFSTSDRTENILTIQLNYNELEPLDTHRNILLSTVTLVDTITFDYSSDNIYPQIRQLIKPMEISKNIMFSGLSSATKSEMTPYQLLFFIDSKRNKSAVEFELSDLTNCNLTDLHIKHLQPYIPSLQKLELRGNSKMSPKSMNCISDVLMQSIEENNRYNLDVINISYCDLTDQHIEYLQPCIPYLKSLNISGNNRISSKSMRYMSDVLLKATKIHSCCNLKEVYIVECDLTDQHIEYLQPCIPYLESLIISMNGKMSFKSMEYISDVLVRSLETHHSCDLKGLELRNCNLTDKHIEYLHPCIPYLENLNIGSNMEMSSKSMEFISDVLVRTFETHHSCDLKGLEIRNCNLTDKHIECLHPCIPYLANLNIGSNREMSSKSMEFISDVLVRTFETHHSCDLKGLEIRNCDLTDKHIECLHPCIPHLENLNIGSNREMSSKSMEFISDVIIRTFETHHSCDLKGLDITSCDLTDEHIEYLHPCIPYLENLNIGSNREMSSKSMEYICNVIVKNMEINKFCNLKVMDISHCNLTDEHVKCLHKCIPYMENLIMSGNRQMSFIFTKYISDALMNVIEEEIDISKACKLKRIDISDCHLTDKHIEYLQSCIPYLENLSISGNMFVSLQGMKYISDALIQRIEVNYSCNLKVIDVSYCDLNDYAIDMMEPCLPYLKHFLSMETKTYQIVQRN